ncbi:arginase [Roseivirga seohaensis]|uniref:Arginase n=2 Tax=Roseivirga seohaensis TaxID=1914963 RepID=A0A0L8AK84_9BACT|nr:arginase [Roseivirga seohaensis]KOF02804.1 arginase [Roseivirga seohaensis subsp. aquiponti]KYG85767.1 arginase [Roseivirga seohaensis]
MRKIRLVEVRSELAAGTRGASLGIDAMKVASLGKRSDFFLRFQPIKVKNENELLFQEPKFKNAKYGEGVYTVLKRVCDAVSDLRSEGLFPIVLAGDHSTAAGTIAGIKKADPDKRLGAIWIDAHADFHSPYTTPSGNMHGMPLAMATAIDNVECEQNDVEEETEALWERIKSIGMRGPKMRPEDVVFIGVRDTESPEDYLMEKYGIKNFTTAEVTEKGIQQVSKEALEILKDCDQIYISFDVDSLDTSVSVGTGTPVPEGLSKEQALELNIELIKDKRVCCWEIVEVNPTLDTENRMANNAFEILEATTESLIQNF